MLNYQFNYFITKSFMPSANKITALVLVIPFPGGHSTTKESFLYILYLGILFGNVAVS